jgi:hypothetical protein
MKVYTPIYLYAGILTTAIGLFITSHSFTIIGVTLVLMGFSLVWMAFYKPRKKRD